MYYITQSTIITSPIGFNIGLTNVDTRLKQLCINVVSTLFQRRALTLYQRCATLKIRRQILFHFQRRINVISMLIHNVETKLIRRLKCWSDVKKKISKERRFRLWKFFWWPSEIGVYKAREPKSHNIIFQNTR